MTFTTGIMNTEDTTIFEMDLEESTTTAWLHLTVDRTPKKAWAVCWVTSKEDENSSPVKVESLWLRLEWLGAVHESINHNISEWRAELHAPSVSNQKAIAKAWSTFPNLGPITAETSQ